MAGRQRNNSRQARNRKRKTRPLSPQQVLTRAQQLNDGGIMLVNQGRIPEALDAFQQATRCKPDFTQAHFNLGNLLMMMQQYPQAAECYRKVTELASDSPQGFFQFAQALRQICRPKESLEALDKAVALGLENGQVHYHRGNALADLQQLEQAAKEFDIALQGNADPAEVHNALGVVRKFQGLIDDAMNQYDLAIQANADYAPAHLNKSFLLLLTGKSREGWKEYEWRWKLPHFARTIPRLNIPVWDGNIQPGQRILIWENQGIGDEVMFTGQIQRLIDGGMDCFIQTDPRLVSLLQRSFPSAVVAARSDSLASVFSGKGIPHHFPLSSLPKLFDLDMSQMEHQRPCLTANPEQVAKLRERYSGRGRWFLVGISWHSGNPTEGPYRSLPLEQWQDILQIRGVRFVNLQYGQCEDTLKRVHQKTGVEIVYDEEVDSMADLDAFASQVAAMDLVISIDNSTVHFAGALGRPVWTLLPAIPDWRWMLNRSDSPWYATMKLFRQETMGDWSPVLQAVEKELADIVKRTPDAQAHVQ